jgi:hypothetical protein
VFLASILHLSLIVGAASVVSLDLDQHIMDVNVFVAPLLKFLSDENNISAEELAKRLVTSFPVSDRFKMACTLSMLLTDNLLPFPQVSCVPQLCGAHCSSFVLSCACTYYFCF